MTVSMRLEGFSELERELEKLTKAAGKGALRRSLKKAAEPLAEKMRDLAPRGDTATDRLAESIAVSTKLSKRQASRHKRAFRNDKASVEMFVGPGPDPAAWNQEFGNVNHGPQPFARPAWDSDKNQMLDRLKEQLWAEVQKSVRRAEAKAARQAAGG